MFDGLPAGAGVALPEDCYHGVSELAREGEAQGAWTVERIAVEDTAAWLNALQAVDLAWLESPSNPLLAVADLHAICAAERSPGTLLVVDNTFATPLLTRPLELGADIVMHSATKYLGGHSDLIGGVAVVRDDAELAERLWFLLNSAGAIQGPFDSFLALRGLKTLPLRMRAHCDNALEIAGWLQRHPAVGRVIYPGLPDHPYHELAMQQMNGRGGGIISIDVNGGLAAARRMLERCRLFSLAESLGGVESLINHPAIMTHASVPEDIRARLGISDTLVRLSVGVEDVEDLKADLDQALS